MSEIRFIKAESVRIGDVLFPGQKHEDTVKRIDVRDERSGFHSSRVVRFYNQGNVLIAKYNLLAPVTIKR